MNSRNGIWLEAAWADLQTYTFTRSLGDYQQFLEGHLLAHQGYITCTFTLASLVGEHPGTHFDGVVASLSTEPKG